MNTDPNGRIKFLSKYLFIYLDIIYNKF